MRPLMIFRVGLAWICVLLTPPALVAQTAVGVNYTLLDASQLQDDCVICGRPTFMYPLRGTFTLTLLESTPLFTRYQLTNIAFTARTGASNAYEFTGGGLYQIGGEVALLQQMTLHLDFKDTSTGS